MRQDRTPRRRRRRIGAMPTMKRRPTQDCVVGYASFAASWDLTRGNCSSAGRFSCVRKGFTCAYATGVIGERTVAWRYGMGCRLKNSHIIGLALKSVTPKADPPPGPQLLSSGQQWPIPVTVQNTTSAPSRQAPYVTHLVDPMLYVSMGVVLQPSRLTQPSPSGGALEYEMVLSSVPCTKKSETGREIVEHCAPPKPPETAAKTSEAWHPRYWDIIDPLE